MNKRKQTSLANSSSRQLRAAPALGSTHSQQEAGTEVRTRSGKRYEDPTSYDHAWPSLAEYARLLVLRYDRLRTRHSYYRDMRLVAEHFDCDPATLSESQLTDYFVFRKMESGWKPKTVRQSAAAGRLFYALMLGHTEWKVFDQVKAKDHLSLPAVLTREQVVALMGSIRLRRYRTPLKLIYCCGLRLSECLNLTVQDVLGSELKLRIREGKGGRDRMVPLPAPMLDELREYWRMHRHPILLFPSAGRGPDSQVRQRMHVATEPMPHNSLQRLLVLARRELNLPEQATPHTLRHSFATHMIEARASLHSVQAILGHAHLNTTEVYLHLTHVSESNSLRLMEELYCQLPK
jgi:site-specific recombinase XerD